MRFVVTLGDRTEHVEITGRGGRYRLTIGGEVSEVDARRTADSAYSLVIGGAAYVADVVPGEDASVVTVGGETHRVRVEEEARHAIRTRGGASAAGARQALAAPLPGKVTHVAVTPGDRVNRGDTLVIIEAMKMENEFRAAAGGTVAEVRVVPGQAVNAGDLLVVIGEP